MTGAARSAEFDAWVAKARGVKIENEIARRSIPLKANGAADRCGPCPKCGGTDRFSINTKKAVWNCRNCGKGGDVIALVQHLDGVEFIAACETLTGEPPPKANGKNSAAEPRKVVVAQFEYHDRDGAVAFAVERMEYRNRDGSPVLNKDGKPKKSFRQKRPDPDRPGEWIYNVDGVPVVLFRLPEVIEAVANEHFVLIAEGERKADFLLASWNVPATTNAGGAGKWRDEHSEFLRGAHVILLPDNDERGRGHVEAVAASLHGIAASIRVLELPDLPPKGDIIDFSRAGGTVERLHELIERDAKPWTPKTPSTKGNYMQGKSALASNVGNVLLALEQEPEIMNAFGYDEMLRTEVLLRPLFRDDPHFVPRPVTDADITAVQAHLQWFGFRRLGTGATHDAIDRHARAHSFHPVRDYLDGLRWDGKPRLGTWLATYAGAEPTEYSEHIGTMFLIGMVARICKPGCKLDYMPVLEGEQGMLKSTLCATLAGKYFSDQLPDITSKEAFQHLRGKWLIEVAELRAYSRAAIDHFKEFLVRDTERFRPPPWGRKEVHEPRQCVFIGTTNKSLYLRDETGNRRFWPVKCGEINLDALRRDRDQLFAEAVALYRGGVPWWPDDAFEQQTIKAEQEARFEPDPWEQPIREYLEGKTRTTILAIATSALGYEIEPPTPSPYGGPNPIRGTPINRLTPKDQQRIAAVLVHLGWEPKHNKSDRWWQPVTPRNPHKMG
jgi:predicted P-loop ATPase